MRTLLGLMLAFVSAFVPSHAAELGPMVGGESTAFGFALGATVTDSSAELLDSTSEVDRYNVVASSYPLGVEQVVVQLSSVSRKVVSVQAAGTAGSPAACDKLVKDYRKNMEKGLNLKFKKSKEFSGAWISSNGSIEHELGCDGNGFRFAMRSPALIRIASEELQSLLASSVCNSPPPSAPRVQAFAPESLTSIASPQFTPARKVELNDYRMQLERIAARVRSHYRSYANRSTCESGGRFEYFAVFDRRGHVVETKLLASDSRSDAMVNLLRREIELERFGAAKEEGYRLVAFSLDLKPAEGEGARGRGGERD